MINFTEHLRTDLVYQDGWLREDLGKVLLQYNDTGRVLEVPEAVMGELLNLLEFGVNDSSPAALGGCTVQLRLTVPREGVRFDDSGPEGDLIA